MSSDFSKVAKALLKEIGANAEGGDIAAWVDTGYPPLNKAVSGSYDKGLPSGRIIEIFGPSSAGKTAIATEAMISAQKMGGIAAFSDHERSFKLTLSVRRGLDTTPGKWIYRKPKTFEEGVGEMFKAVRTIRGANVIKPEAPIVWVFDSLASMIPASVWEKIEKGEPLKMNDKLALASLTSQQFPAIAVFAEEYNVCVIFLNQIRMDPGVTYGNPEKTPGGKAPPFYASVRIQLGATRLTKTVEGEPVMTGSEIKARCIKNKVNRPYLSTKWRFSFRDDGTGYFDTNASLAQLAIEKKLINVPTKGWYEWEGKNYRLADLVALFDNDKASQSKLNQLIIDSDIELEEDKTDIKDDTEEGGLEE